MPNCYLKPDGNIKVPKKLIKELFEGEGFDLKEINKQYYSSRTIFMKLD
jgi:hypothetical protein